MWRITRHPTGAWMRSEDLPQARWIGPFPTEGRFDSGLPDTLLSSMPAPRKDGAAAGGIPLPRGVIVRDRDPSKDIGTLRFWQVCVKPSTASHCGKRCRSGRNSGTMPAGGGSPRNETAYVGSASMGGTASKQTRPGLLEGARLRKGRTRWQCGSQLRMTAGTDRPRGTAHMPRPDGVGVGLGEIAPSRRVKSSTRPAA